MIGELKNNILESKKVKGVELFITADGEWKFSTANMLKDKVEISVKEESSLLSKEDFLAQHDNKTPIALLINGNGILNKEIENHQRDISKLLHSFMPNADVDQFVTEIDRTNDKGMISVIRKDQYEKIIDFFKSHNFRIIGLNIGLSVFNVFRTLIDSNEIQCTGYDLTFQNEGITKFETHEKQAISYNLEGKTHSSDVVGALSVGFNHWLRLRNIELSDDLYVAFSRIEEKNRNILEKAGIVVLAILFGGLLINLLMYQHYGKKVADLSAEVSKKDEILNELNFLTSEIDVKKDLIKSVGGVNNRAYFAYYADNIAASVPEQLTLQKMLFRPLSKKLKENKKVQFVNGEIEIEGLSLSSAKLNAWMSEMRNLEFVKEVELVTYLREGKNKGLFELKIEII